MLFFRVVCRTTVKTLSTEGELLRAVQDDEVVVVLLQPKDAKQDDIVRGSRIPVSSEPHLTQMRPPPTCAYRTLRPAPPRP